jgi:hypothetical protein
MTQTAFCIEREREREREREGQFYVNEKSVPIFVQ